MHFLRVFPFLFITTSALLPFFPPKPPASPEPTITIDTGTIIGHTAHGVESYNGIPFAEPPIKELRLKPPRPLTQSFGTIKSVRNARACPQFYFRVHSDYPLSNIVGGLINTPPAQILQDVGEDCLTLNVQRPVGVDNSTKLPVVFWVFGGGFELGSTQMYDGAKFVNASAEMGQPVVWVAVNYRLVLKSQQGCSISDFFCL